MKKQIPKPEKTFKLTSEGEIVEPLAMVKARGCRQEGWKHRGKLIKSPVCLKFMVTKVGHSANWAELVNKLQAKGRIPEGQWLDVFFSTFEVSNLPGPIGVADATWFAPGGANYFPIINIRGRLDFYWPRDSFNNQWLWLVETSRLSL